MVAFRTFERHSLTSWRPTNMLSFEVRKPGGESEVRKVHRDVIHLGASSGNDLVVRARGVLGRHAASPSSARS